MAPLKGATGKYFLSLFKCLFTNVINSFLYLSSRDLDRTREVNSKIPKSDLNARRRKDTPLLLGRGHS